MVFYFGELSIKTPQPGYQPEEDQQNNAQYDVYFTIALHKAGLALRQNRRQRYAVQQNDY